jgi:GNAT superfamily N-acetyltransferase
MVVEHETHSLIGKMVFYDEPHINGNRDGVFFYATDAWMELVELKLADERYAGFDPSDSVVYCRHDDGDLVGLIVYKCDMFSKRAMIQLGWVVPHLRNQGVYRNLITFFERALRAKGIEVYESIVHEKNKPMAKAVESRDIIGSFTRKTI